MKRLILVYSFFSISLGGLNAEAQDVYNFYFQKAPGPNTVVQGASVPQEVTEEVVEDSATPTVAESPAIEEEEAPAPAVTSLEETATVPPPKRQKDYKDWALYFGPGAGRDGMGSHPTWVLGGDLNFTRDWGLHGQLIGASDDDEKDGKDSRYSREKGKHGTHVALGVHWMPVHIGTTVDAGLLVGFMTSKNSMSKRGPDLFSDYNEDTYKGDTTIVKYVGVAVGVNILPNIFALAQTRLGWSFDSLNGGVITHSQTFAALGVRF